MFGNLPVFRLSMSLARHAAAEQALAARNAANADTPGYRALRMRSFPQVVGRGSVGFSEVRATRAQHFDRPIRHFEDDLAEASPNANSVSLENEMIAGVQASRAHKRALAIYRSHLSMMRAAVSRS